MQDGQEAQQLSEAHCLHSETLPILFWKPPCDASLWWIKPDRNMQTGGHLESFIIRMHLDTMKLSSIWLEA